MHKMQAVDTKERMESVTRLVPHQVPPLYGAEKQAFALADASQRSKLGAKSPY